MRNGLKTKKMGQSTKLTRPGDPHTGRSHGRVNLEELKYDSHGKPIDPSQKPEPLSRLKISPQLPLQEFGPKWSGGLGMRQLKDQNIAFLLKLGYKLVFDDESLWSLSKVWSLLHDNLIWSTGDGNRIRCWKDQWIPNEWLLEEIISQIMGIPPPHPTEGPDRLSWRHTSTGVFSVKIAYKMLKEDSWNSRDELWKTAWKILSPQRRILTNVERVRRGLANDASCSVYGHAYEDILHIIQDCTVAKEDTSRVYGGEIIWACLFGLLAWSLWKNCNLSILQMKSWSLNEIIKVSMCWAKHASLDSRSGSSDYTVSPHKEPTSKDWIYLNANGAVSRTSGRAAAGGVIRDSAGNWIMGYNRFLGNCSIFDAELWGILDGLKLIQCRGHDNVIIHSDSLEVVKAIHENVLKNSTSALLRRIHRILSQERQWIIRHTPREENKSADYLAKLALGRKEDFHLIKSPPDEMLVYLEADKERIFVSLGTSL
ncbi:hypothetical protein CXB51_028213 [Gossypium anomalum]|uniref:RNase H type-1 domain-containing protein n=1 Tax=Gossypium anomalum TaxID=47600 RepID=A0A8J5YEH9_9ROSI|nr:hypothetical protein CXB51_028213 [Gossypium anomalum]